MLHFHCVLVGAHLSASRRWPGGSIHRTKDGRDLYLIERKVAGRRYHVSTRCHSYAAAMKHLERFEADPAGYRPGGDAVMDVPLRLTRELALEFRTWQIEVRGNTTKHANEMSHRLAEWLEDLKGADLRRASLREHIKPALERRTTGRQHRIIALKAFYAWLRKEKHLLTHGQDPTIDLPVPSPRPEKLKRRKVVPKGNVEKVLRQLTGGERDCLLILANTGMHVTELERLVRSRESEVTPRKGRTLAIITFRHKRGDDHSIAITSQEVLDAVRRLREAGEMPRRFSGKVKAACAAAGVDAFGPGVMRHSYGTWAVEQGVAPADVARVLGHKDQSTTRRFYLDTAALAVPIRVETVIH